MRVLKFGGSSVAHADTIKQLKQIVENKRKQNSIVIVVSALQEVTDDLDSAIQKAATGNDDYRQLLEEVEKRHIHIMKELLSVQEQSSALTRFKVMFNELSDVLHGVSLTHECTSRSRDFVMGFGERFSAFIISEYLEDSGTAADYVDARDLIKTDKEFGSAEVLIEESYQNIRDYIDKIDDNKVLVVTGYIASTGNGETTTLGRGGSDYTASLFGAALEADAVELWTDVEGFMTADPRRVSRNFTIPDLSYEEAMELSHFGAQIVYPPTVQPAMNASIPILIKNTFEPDHEGTRISVESPPAESMVKGISSIDNITLLTVRGSGMIGVTGISARLFGALADASINIIMITQSSSEHTICFAVLPDQANKAREAIEEEFHYEINDDRIQDIKIENELSIVAVVGDDMRRKPGISGRVFQALGRNGINVAAIAQGSSERNITVVVDRLDEEKTLNTLHDAFFLADVKTINLFLVGMGLIGGRLLELIQQQTDKLLEDHKIELQLTGVSNSSQYLIDREGISMSEYKQRLDQEAETADIDQFISQMAELNVSDSIFIDCTASQIVSEKYADVLKSNISIVTANKKANSSTFSHYEKLQDLAFENNVAYLYETNVGAGLPVIATLREQIVTGDEIKCIEGVLSGTLSYIFNNFDGKESFSKVVRSAREKGYTEPDPREDLNGQDVGRKLLILAREAGLELEFEDIEIQNMVPEDAREVQSVDEFFEILESHDESFQSLYEEAAEENLKLCYIARYEGEKATVRLEKIAPDHPFYSLSGSDNIVAFNTTFYQESPIVVKGPGAGAEVTASGIIADILRISSAPSFRGDL